MTEREKLEKIVAHLEDQRAFVGDGAVDSALAVLRERLLLLDTSEGVADAEHLDDPAPRVLYSPLIGRTAELTVVQRRVGLLQDGKGGAIGAFGEAGVGKSRLIAEVRERIFRAGTPSIQWLEGSALSQGRVTPYWPFREILWQSADITEEDQEDDVWQKLRSRLEMLFGEKTNEFLPYLATLISLDAEKDFDEQIKYLNGDAMRRQVFLCSRRLFEAMARSQPLAIVFEDLQWIDESSSLLLQHLLPLTYRAPILVICVSRPTVGTPQARLREALSTLYHDRYTEIVLDRLSSLHSSQLVTRLLDDDPPSALRDKIVEKSEGNPLFIQEIIRALIGDGLLFRKARSNEWQIATGISDAMFPRTIQDTVMARVDLLDPPQQHVLKVAAVIGRSFFARVVHMVIQDDIQQLEAQLATLQNMSLILRDSRSPELAYSFCHDLTHEIIYEHIEPSERRRLHSEVGTAIEHLFSGRLDEFYSVLAYHYSRAEDWQKAQQYLFKAGDQAGVIAADTEALAHYEQAVQAYAHAFGAGWDPLEQATLGRKIGAALFRLGQYDRAVGRLDEALACLGKAVRKSRWNRIYLFHELARQIVSRSWGHRFPTSETIAPEVEEEFRIHEALFWIHSSTDVERFLFHTVALLNLSEHHGFGLGMALGYSAAGVSCDFLSLFRLARHYHRLGMENAERVRHPLSTGYAHMGNALHACTLAEWDRAVDFSDSAAEAFAQIGDLKSWAYVTHLQCCALTSLCDYTLALDRSRNMFETADDLGDAEAAGRAKWNEGCVLSRLGLLDDATQCLDQALALGRTAGNPISSVIASHELVLISLRRNQLETALDQARELQRMFTQYRVTQYLCVPSHNAITETYLRKTEVSRGADKAFWMTKAQHACMSGLKQSKACGLVRPEAMRLKGVYEWLSGKPKLAKKWWRRGLAVAEKTGQRYDAAMILIELGKRLGDRECLDRSNRILTELRHR